eukprot:749483-Rhodomonas_salina.2
MQGGSRTGGGAATANSVSAWTVPPLCADSGCEIGAEAGIVAMRTMLVCVAGPVSVASICGPHCSVVGGARASMFWTVTEIEVAVPATAFGGSTRVIIGPS